MLAENTKTITLTDFMKTNQTLFCLQLIKLMAYCTEEQEVSNPTHSAKTS
jgi:hypothetical protein